MYWNTSLDNYTKNLYAKIFVMMASTPVTNVTSNKYIIFSHITQTIYIIIIN